MKKSLYQYPKKWLIYTTGLMLFICSCKKTVSIDPPVNQLTNDKVFATDNSAIAAMAGIYARFIATSIYDYLPTLLPALSADELNNYTTISNYTTFNNNAILPSDTYNKNLWAVSYNIIYQANALIENLQSSTTISTATQTQLTGEAKFIRAFMYFELVNFYADVPLVTTTNVAQTSIAARTAKMQVYQQIIADLKDAQNLLTNTYAGPDRARANQSAATALLARVYLYQQDWQNAAAQATTLINNSGTYSLVSTSNLAGAFQKGSMETIFQFATANGFTDIGNTIIPGSTAPNFAFTNDFIGAIEVGDQRKINWMKPIINGTTTYYYPYKYRQRTTAATNPEYLVVLRLGEQYLIRAEAKAQQGTDLTGAAADLNMIRNRVGLLPTTATTQATLLTAIEKERRIELFTEWGHRWFDLKRTGRADAVLGNLKPGWQTNVALYPIPLTELSANPSLIQNAGY